MYYLGWVSLVVISLWVSLLAFLWAMKSGQFSDQGRARYLPLAEDFPPCDVKEPSKLTLHSYVMLAVIIIGILVTLSPVALILYKLKGTG